MFVARIERCHVDPHHGPGPAAGASAAGERLGAGERSEQAAFTAGCSDRPPEQDPGVAADQVGDDLCQVTEVGSLRGNRRIEREQNAAAAEFFEVEVLLAECLVGVGNAGAAGHRLRGVQ